VNFKRLPWGWFIALGIFSVVLVCAFWFDDSVQEFIKHHRNRPTWVAMRRTSRVGDWPAHFAVGLLLAILAWLRGSNKWTRIFLSMLLACALAGVATRVIKVTVGRARPAMAATEEWRGPTFYSRSQAFPSGHTASSTAFFAVLFFANRRLGLICSPIPVLIAFSRIYTAQHYLSDVVAAAFLGLLCAFIITRVSIFPQIENRQSAIEN
jgi:membrane-associated phospholipid phosphatase